MNSVHKPKQVSLTELTRNISYVLPAVSGCLLSFI